MIPCLTSLGASLLQEKHTKQFDRKLDSEESHGYCGSLDIIVPHRLIAIGTIGLCGEGVTSLEVCLNSLPAACSSRCTTPRTMALLKISNYTVNPEFVFASVKINLG